LFQQKKLTNQFTTATQTIKWLTKQVSTTCVITANVTLLWCLIKCVVLFYYLLLLKKQMPIILDHHQQ